MNSLAFIDTEIDPKSGHILDIGAVKDEYVFFHSKSINAFVDFLKGQQFICGHNVLNHDIKYIKKVINVGDINLDNIIDTLYLSPLLFPTRPYHKLVKDDKLQSDELNNPLNDSIKAKDLFYEELESFKNKPEYLKQIYFLLLSDQIEFKYFFKYINYKTDELNVSNLIKHNFKSVICDSVDLTNIVSTNPIELAYCLALIECNNRYSITPPWVLKNYPYIENVMFLLRCKPCIVGCDYCNESLNIKKGLKKYFGFENYRTYSNEPLQENAVNAAINNKSILAVFPTGGGKSITFQVPALMRGECNKGLTVIISPLQSLMKDQVDNLESRGITDSVTINGLLDPIERAKSYERVEDGSASLLYLSPESLRSKTIERLLLGRNVVRFVIDEAHCFSSWGQDFRVDYLYIGDFIYNLQEKKNLNEPIPVSCFTATAKQNVIEDIKKYFRDKLNLDLELFSSKSSRTNLHYKVIPKNTDEEKYLTTRNLIDEKNCPTIVYVSRTRKAFLLAKRLCDDGFNAKPYHGKMDSKEKTANQNAFIKGDVQIMVATSAFGMGVDKKDVRMVIHYEISDSLENYIQEAGRAGRDENISADCYVLFDEEDLSKHFIMLNQTKLSIKEIQQIWKAIKDITKFKGKFSNSALEIARKAGWDDSLGEIETRVKTAIAALEDAGYIKRGQNMPRIYASSILAKNVQEAIEKIMSSNKFDEKQKEKGIRIIKKLFSSKSKSKSNDEVAESRIDYISEHLGIVKEDVINVINLLREEKILADTKDLTAFIKRGEGKNKSLNILENFIKIENSLLPEIDENEKTIHIKELNEKIEQFGCKDVTPNKIKTLLNFWAIKNWVKKSSLEYSKNHIVIISNVPKKVLQEKLECQQTLARFIVDLLFQKCNNEYLETDYEKEEFLIEFSVHEIKEEYDKTQSLFRINISIEDVENALFFLSRIEAIKIEGGFLVLYNKLSIERLEHNNKIQYKNEDYTNLNKFYENKIQQIHIVGAYAKKMIEDYTSALKFVDDYFQLNYSTFLGKYFNVNEQREITRNITPSKFKQLFGELSPTQLKIINDIQSKYIVVAAGPGSGKTKVLVHKLASLLLMEDVKHEQLLMVTFSRGAATEFKKRLLKLIGNAANFIEIKTFHSYCFDLLGKVGTLEKSSKIIENAILKIKNGEVEHSGITKNVLVIDEAQDMDGNEFELVKTLIANNEEMRVIAVGDDDQNIFEFRGASSKYLENFIIEQKAVSYEMIENFRSKKNLVEFTTKFAKQISHRLKQTPVFSNMEENGNVKIVKYKNTNLILPLVKDVVATELRGSTCILTHSNDEAAQVTGLLLKHGHQAKLIQTNDNFNLLNLLEIRFFIHALKLEENTFTIDEENWAEAKKQLKEKYFNSTNYETCLNIIRDFEITNNKRKYKSDLDIYIRESKLEDFINSNGDIIFVSTIHKSKGKEFDNVFLLLDNYSTSTDINKRLLYVAMTRAKQNLTIHLNGNYLDNILVENIKVENNNNIHPLPLEILKQVSYKDVWLDYFINKQWVIKNLKGGDRLIYKNQECVTEKGHSILKFSTQFQGYINDMNAKGFYIKEVKIDFIIYWKKENVENEILIILPEITFERTNTLNKQ